MPPFISAGTSWHRLRVRRLALDLAACLALSAAVVVSALAGPEPLEAPRRHGVVAAP